MWKYLVDKWQKEPAVITNAVIALLQSILILLVAFGVNIDDSQSNAIITLAATLLALFGGAAAGQIIRRNVTPLNRKKP